MPKYVMKYQSKGLYIHSILGKRVPGTNRRDWSKFLDVEFTPDLQYAMVTSPNDIDYELNMASVEKLIEQGVDMVVVEVEQVETIVIREKGPGSDGAF